MRDDPPRCIKLKASIPLDSKEDFAERLIESLRDNPDGFPLDEYCTNGGGGQDADILSVEITSFGKSDVTGLLSVSFTEKYFVGCADIRFEEKHRVVSSFWYRDGDDSLEVERGYRKREYEREEF